MQPAEPNRPGVPQHSLGAELPPEESFGELRPLLFSIAYQMIGSVVDAEDIVSESYLRLRGAVDSGRQIRNLKQYLATTVTRLSIDHLRDAQARREAYEGPWLPEPLVGDGAASDFERVELADTISMAFLVLLESLSPTERAVFLLREVFEFDYPTVARIVDKSEANCRQLLRRAKRQVEARKPRFEVDARRREELACLFFTAIQDGDIEPLVTLLAEDVVMYGDGGGQGPSLPRPINGRDKVLQLLKVFAGMSVDQGLHIKQTLVNGQPGAVVRTPDGRLLNVMSLDIADGSVQTVRSVLSPEKLHHLGPLVDRELLRNRGRAHRRSS
jgi:RNA polymerase sigma-70 factor (ECF subfamily)